MIDLTKGCAGALRQMLVFDFYDVWRSELVLVDFDEAEDFVDNVWIYSFVDEFVAG